MVCFVFWKSIKLTLNVSPHPSAIIWLDRPTRNSVESISHVHCRSLLSKDLAATTYATANDGFGVWSPVSDDVHVYVSYWQLGIEPHIIIRLIMTCFVLCVQSTNCFQTISVKLFYSRTGFGGSILFNSQTNTITVSPVNIGVDSDVVSAEKFRELKCVLQLN